MLVVALAAVPAVAQITGPGPVPPPAEPSLWQQWLRLIAEQQREFYRALSGAMRAVQQEGALGPALALTGLAFAYGVFHAVGPGHGKVVITAYLLASREQLRRGVLLAFLAGGLQGLVAILLVGVVAVVLSAPGLETRIAGRNLELASYALIALAGLWLAYMGLRGRGHHHHHHDHGHHDHGHHDHGHHDHGHDHACGHAPLPPREPLTVARAFAIAGAVGIRPCSGAIVVLLFALGQGIFWVGVGATMAMALGTAITVSLLAVLTVLFRNVALRVAGGGPSRTAWIERGLAVAGGLAIVAFGALMLSAAWTLPGAGSPLY